MTEFKDKPPSTSVINERRKDRRSYTLSNKLWRADLTQVQSTDEKVNEFELEWVQIPLLMTEMKKALDKNPNTLFYDLTRSFVSNIRCLLKAIK